MILGKQVLCSIGILILPVIPEERKLMHADSMFKVKCYSHYFPIYWYRFSLRTCFDYFKLARNKTFLVFFFKGNKNKEK